MNKAFLPYDIYERHKRVGKFIESNHTVLDVGGELHHLSQFSSPTKIIVANLTGGDVVIKKGKLPFSNNSFDIVCAIDVLEHIVKKKRKQFIENLIKVAKKRVILSFPVGTLQHLKYEKETQAYLRKKGKSVTYLEEHIMNGLPTEKEVDNLTKHFKRKIFFSGNIFINKYLFRFFIFDPQIKFLRKAVYYFKLFFNLLTNPLFYVFLARRKYSKSVNRAYLLIEKA